MNSGMEGSRHHAQINYYYLQKECTFVAGFSNLTCITSTQKKICPHN